MACGAGVVTSYNPADGGDLDNDEYEFIELKNTGLESLPLAGAKLTDGVLYAVPDSSALVLEPGEIIVIVKNRSAFSARYDAGAMLIAPALTPTRRVGAQCAENR